MRASRGAVIALLMLLAALNPAGSASAHPPGSGVSAHPDDVNVGARPASFGVSLPVPPRPFAPPSQIGRWSSPRQVSVVGIHAALLHTGKVLLFQGRSGAPGSHARLLDPATGALETVDVPFSREHFCSGHVFLPGGRLLVAGGEGNGIASDGPKWVSIFNPVTERWSKADSMTYGRYYPGMLELPDGSAIAVSGTPPDGSGTVKQIERYDPATGQWSTLPGSADVNTELYPRLLLLPNGNVFRAGPEQDSRLFDQATNKWSYVGHSNFGHRTEGAAVLLPGLQRVLAAGGSQTLAPSTNTAEVIDFSEPNPRWRYTDSMNRPRMNANLVLTADGKVLAVGGGLGGIYGPPVLESEVYNPATGRWSLMDAQQAPRDYHSTALLLPDGRVLSAGQDQPSTPGQRAGGDLGLRSTTIEYFRPAYLFRGPRPRISSAPKSLTYGRRFTIGTPDASEISRVALVKPGTATHSVNFDQRYVDLKFSRKAGAIRARTPAGPAKAPPGHYMLFILNSKGVPAVAKFVRLA